MPDTLRPIDKKRTVQAGEIISSNPAYGDMWFIHTVLAQCFLPYRDPKTRDWTRQNGDYSIAITAGLVKDAATSQMKPAGLPYGAKPRLFQSYICTQAIRQKSPVIPVEQSMTAMMHELGLKVTGGKTGTINGFNEQITRFAACNFTLVGPGPRGGERYVKAPPIESFDVWFPPDPHQQMLWPSEIVLTNKYYESLKDHAIPFDFRGLKAIQNKPRTQDIYLWMTQRLCRIGEEPLLLRWPELHQMFGGTSTMKAFRWNFSNDLIAAYAAYPMAQIEEHTEGYLFRESPPPIAKIQIVKK